MTKWQESGFKVDATTNFVVLTSTREGNIGNKQTTCTLVQKGDNYAQVENAKCGDLDNSGQINIFDTTILLDHINGSNLLSEDMLKYADTTGDGNITIADVSKIADYINGLGNLNCK